MVFLEVLTRCYQRPGMLARNQASLARQTSADWMQTLLIDEEGRGIGWSYRNMADYAPHLTGDYIWILDDDDECTDETLVESLKAVTELTQPGVVMMKMDHGEPLGVLPDAAYWGSSPECGHIGVSAFVVERELWQRNADVLRSSHYASDYDFISAIWREPVFVAWLDRITSRTQRVSHGKPESLRH